jgi:phosphoribosylformimino-5-aminoimidazole carboxamide ribotide isomerase
LEKIAEGMMQILPVMDLLGGRVVRGVAGRRQEYRPVVSQIAKSCQPLDVATAFRDHFGLTELYVADLEAIAGAEPAWKTYQGLHDAGFRLRVDAGVREASRARHLAEAGIATLVVGLETVAGPDVLAELARTYGERLQFSLDLKGGEPLGEVSAWKGPDAYGIAVQVVGLGVRRLLVLDLARVGVGQGLGTEELCSRLAAAHPEVEISAGGGVRGLADLRRLRDCGVRAALVASALHDGVLRRADLDGL